jgi:hypothetical protein
MVDKAFEALSCTNFFSADVSTLFSVMLAHDLPVEMKRRLLGMLNCDRLIVRPDFLKSKIAGSLDATRLVYWDRALPRAYVAGGMEVLPNDLSVIVSLGTRPFDPEGVALTGRQSAGEDSFADLKPGKVKHKIRRLEYGQNSLKIDVQTDSSGILVVSDTYYPGWHATVDGKVVPIYKVNGAFRGVRIQAGTSTVKMEYRPAFLRLGIAISLVTLTLVIALAIFAKGTNVDPCRLSK